MGVEYKAVVRAVEGAHQTVGVFTRTPPGDWAFTGQLTTRAGLENAALCTRLRLAMPVEYGDGTVLPQFSGDGLFEALADVQHDIWSHWMRYVMDKVCHPQAGVPDGSLVIPADSVTHWRRQCETRYADLTEREQASDREQVAKFWPLVAPSPVEPT